jgi:hypothetical protein
MSGKGAKGTFFHVKFEQNVVLCCGSFHRNFASGVLPWGRHAGCTADCSMMPLFHIASVGSCAVTSTPPTRAVCRLRLFALQPSNNGSLNI